MERPLSISCTKCICTNCDRRDECIYCPCNTEEVGTLYCRWVMGTCELTRNDEKTMIMRDADGSAAESK